MEQIRLTCGGCNKRYRLPGNAVGYFRCRNCDLVMAIPTVASTPASRAAAPAPAQTLASEQEFEVLNEDDLDEIVMDPSTNQPVHLTPGTSGSFSSEQIGTPGQPFPTPYKQYRKHIKQQSAFSPADAAAIFVGVCMVLGGWFAIVLQLLKDGADTSPSMVALMLGLLSAIGGTALVAYGLRRNKMILLPAVITGGAATLLLFGISIAPTQNPNDTELVEEEDFDDGLFDPGESEFNIENQRKKAAERKDKLDDVDDQLKELRKRDRNRNRPDRNSRRRDNGRGKDRNNKKANEPEKKSRNDTRAKEGGNPFESTNRNPFASRDRNSRSEASGKNAREIQRLWTSVTPDKRHKILDDMEDVVEDGLDEADDSERRYWEMFEERLKSLREFDDGKWVSLDFEYGLTGWSVANLDSVVVESDESVQIQPTTPEKDRAMLSSADLFYGPISLQATLKVNGGRSDTPNLGLVFGAGKDDESIADEDCVVLFDPSFRKMRSGPFGSNTKAVSLSRLSPPVSTSKPINLQVNICSGYLQVLANKQLLVEKFDPAIQGANSVSVALLDDTSGSINVTDWQVRRWKLGRPPGKKGFVEEELMYLERAIKDFDDVGWYHYRHALALFGCKRFKRAAEAARKAEKLGIPRSKMAIIFAMEQELEKNYSEAATLYTQMAPGAGQEIAKAWHAWFVLTHPDAAIRAKPISRNLTHEFYPDTWVVKRIRAAIEANKGNYSVASRMLDEIVRDVPVKWRGDTRKQQQDYQSQQPYVRGRGRIPFYQFLKVRIKPDQLEYVEASD